MKEVSIELLRLCPGTVTDLLYRNLSITSSYVNQWTVFPFSTILPQMKLVECDYLQSHKSCYLSLLDCMTTVPLKVRTTFQLYSRLRYNSVCMTWTETDSALHRNEFYNWRDSAMENRPEVDQSSAPLRPTAIPVDGMFHFHSSPHCPCTHTKNTPMPKWVHI